MGYDLHLTRADDWERNQGSEIRAGEWLDLVQADSELELDPSNGPTAAIWKGHPENRPDAWLDWSEGNVFTTNPDRALFRKMLEMSASLRAWIQGDDKERYESFQDYRANEDRLSCGWHLRSSGTIG